MLIVDEPTQGVHRVSRWIFNSYVIAGTDGGRPLVIDVGLTSQVPTLNRLIGVQAATGSGSGTARIRTPLVCATHLHTDHVGGVPTLCRTRHIEFGAPAKGRDYAAGERPRGPGPREVARIAPVLRDQPFDRGAYPDLVRNRRYGFGSGAFHLPTDVTEWLDDGDELTGAPGWHVVRAPGHTDDSIAFHHPERQILASGDAVLSVGGRAWFTPELTDRSVVADTVDRLRSLRVRVLLPGHGRPVVAVDVWRDALDWTERPDRALRYHRS